METVDFEIKEEFCNIYDYYFLLEIEHDATKKDIDKAFRDRIRKYHPDLNKAQGVYEKFNLLNEAYKRLRSAEGRKKYDSQLEICSREGDSPIRISLEEDLGKSSQDQDPKFYLLFINLTK